MMNKRKKGGWVKWLLMGIVLVVLLALAVPTISNLISGNSAGNVPANATRGNMQQSTDTSGLGTGGGSSSTSTARRGTLSVAVSGSGKVSPADTRSVYSSTTGQVDELNVAVGDTVKQGDVMMTLSSDDLTSSIASLQSSLFAAQIALSEVRDTGSSYYIYSPCAGRLKTLKVEEEDDVATAMKQHGYLAVISRDGKMRVEFAPPTGQTLQVGDKVNVWIKNAAVEGRVEQTTGLLGGNISVTIDDDSYDVGEAVMVSTLQGEKLGEGVLAVNMPVPVTGIGGSVSTIYYEEDDTVGSGYKLFYLTGRTPSSDLQTAILAYEEARVALQNAKDQQEGLVIRAPIDGVITAVDVSKGALLEKGDTAFAIQSNDTYDVVASVDELDIVDVKVGQSVAVELDAYPGKTFNALVERVSGVGTVEGGVATYEVTCRLEGNSGFMDGMTASIDVKTVNKENVILVPVEAISTSNGQNYVTLANGTQSQVETGVSDGTNIEIISGVSEGDSVLITRTGNSGSTGTFSAGTSGSGSSGSGNRSRDGAVMGGGMGGGPMMGF